MTTFVNEIINKYQGVAPKQVINAVHSAAKRTGVDFSFLMEKANAESGFDPKAKAKSSSATGLFQFIESTWLKMVKEHGAKYGLGHYAAQIEERNGKPCVDDCNVRRAILNLRKNPEIAALMAGEFSAENKQYLQNHTDGKVGRTELYLAHFLGAGSAAKFINRRDDNGNIAAAKVFPKEAKANRNVFFDAVTGRARTLNDVYNNFAKKFNGGTITPSLQSAPSPTLTADAGSTKPAPAQSIPPVEIAQALLSFNALGITEEDPLNRDYASVASAYAQKVSADNIMIMAQQIQKPTASIYAASKAYNS